jgi:hypothetical protein
MMEIKDMNQNKTWKTVSTFTTGPEADQKRNELRDKHSLVKVKRGGPRGDTFRVKAWDEPVEDKKSVKVKNKLSVKTKKGQNTQRAKKKLLRNKS